MFDYLILARVRNGSHVLPAKKGSGGPNTSLLYHLLKKRVIGVIKRRTDGRWNHKIRRARVKNQLRVRAGEETSSFCQKCEMGRNAEVKLKRSRVVKTNDAYSGIICIRTCGGHLRSGIQSKLQ